MNFGPRLRRESAASSTPPAWGMTEANPRFAAARIKKLMQADDDVGRISASVPPLVSRCVELFAEELIDEAAAVAQSEDTGAARSRCRGATACGR